MAEPLASRAFDEPHPERLDRNHPHRAAILAAHRAALSSGAPGYLDPGTGFIVLSASYLAERGTCCGSRCRHCPYVGA